MFILRIFFGSYVLLVVTCKKTKVYLEHFVCFVLAELYMANIILLLF